MIEQVMQTIKQKAGMSLEADGFGLFQVIHGGRGVC